MRFFIKTLGCRTNISESESLLDALLEKGFIYAEDNPELIVVNSCTVTAKADRKTRQALQALQNKFPQARCVVIGCGVRNSSLFWPVESYRSYEDFLSTIKSYGSDGKKDKSVLKVRAHVKIQEGCNNRCSYCIVPFVRGPERSLALDDIVKEVKKHLARGVREIVLTGTHIANWGKDFHKPDKLYNLVQTLLSETDLELLRLSSLEPQDFESCLLKIFAEARVCPYIHLALQSGSNEILTKMQRHYGKNDVKKLIHDLRSVRPDIFIGADVIVAFPGEGDEQFQETYDFCREMSFSKLHVFPYSKRTGTKAATWPEVEKETSRQRVAELRDLSSKMLTAYAEQFVGIKTMFLCEGFKDGITKGTNSNFLKVAIAGERPDLIGKLLEVTLVSWDPDREVFWGALSD